MWVMKKVLVLVFLFMFTSCANPQDKIILKRTEGNLFEVPVVLNGSVRLPFIIDTGASESSIPSYVAYTLVRSGTVAPSDMLESQTYTLANGAKEVNMRLRINKIVVSGIEVHNVIVSVSNSINAPLLLGQNVLKEFKQVKFDYRYNTLEVEK